MVLLCCCSWTRSSYLKSNGDYENKHSGKRRKIRANRAKVVDSEDDDDADVVFITTQNVKTSTPKKKRKNYEVRQREIVTRATSARHMRRRPTSAASTSTETTHVEGTRSSYLKSNGDYENKHSGKKQKIRANRPKFVDSEDDDDADVVFITTQNVKTSTPKKKRKNYEVRQREIVTRATIARRMRRRPTSAASTSTETAHVEESGDGTDEDLGEEEHNIKVSKRKEKKQQDGEAQQRKTGSKLKVKGSASTKIRKQKLNKTFKMSKKIKKQNFHRYIQKKLSPEIFTNLLSHISDEQKQWLRSTGLGDMLELKMFKYVHRLGYNIVESFNNVTCCLNLKCGSIKIDEVTVNQIIGLPMGPKVVELEADLTAVEDWGSQFLPISPYKVTASMVAEKIKSCGEVTKLFKLNFLLLMVNFMIESNHNSYINREILAFSGDIDRCGDYNWCKLLILKLVSTHSYWANKPESRYFTGPLPFLTYLYIDRVQIDQTRSITRTTPAYKTWSDEVLKNVEKWTIKNSCFGEGSILELQTQVLHIRDNNFEEHLDEFMDNFECNDGDKDDSNAQENLEADVDDDTNETICINDIAQEQINKHQGQFQEKIGSHTTVQGNNQGINLFDDNFEEHLDEFMDKYLRDEAFMTTLELKIDSFLADYQRILQDEATALKLYPNHPKTVMLRERLRSIFSKCVKCDNIIGNHEQTTQTPPTVQNDKTKAGLDDLSPWSTPVILELENIEKSLSISKTMKSTHRDVSMDIPSFSLGLTPSPDTDLKMNVDRNEKSELKNEKALNAFDGRGKRELRPTQFLKSPYVDRVVPITYRGNRTEEDTICKWVFDSKEENNMMIFDSNNIGCTKQEMQSLSPGAWVAVEVIDTWSFILNDEEKRRSDSSPFRLFCPIQTTVGPLASLKRTMHQRITNFAENIENLLEKVSLLHAKTLKPSDFDMFFFPIYKRAHHYLVCFDMKNCSWEIIDNKVADMETYGTTPYDLYNLFAMWLNDKIPTGGESIYFKKPTLMRMNWQTKHNDKDCGVFVMRHMETYKGKPWKEWDTDLCSESRKQTGQLQQLRRRYCHGILCNKLNAKKDIIIKRSYQFAQNQKSILGDTVNTIKEK